METIYESAEITGETVVDISANLFGNQEFINSLAMDNSTQAKNINNNIASTRGIVMLVMKLSHIYQLMKEKQILLNIVMLKVSLN